MANTSQKFRPVMNVPKLDELTEKVKLSKIEPEILKASYEYCKVVTKNHYENFPVASGLLPKSIRPAIEAIYAFARMADDFADEADYKGVRMDRLNEWEHFLTDQGRSTHPVFIALKDTIIKHNLPDSLFLDLLSAFKQDVVKPRYSDFEEVLDYCTRSANPVGRLVLHLFKQDSETNLKHSDYICTGLQLANFWQDISIDLKKDRIYIPQDDLDRFRLTDRHIFEDKPSEAFKRIMNFQVERTYEIFEKGKPLGKDLKGMLGIEIRLTWLTGVTILKKIRSVQYDVFYSRPKLKKLDFIKLFFTALSKKRYDKFKL